MIYKKAFTLLFVFVSCFILYSNAAFPINTTKAAEYSLPIEPTGAYQINNSSVKHYIQNQQDDAKPVKAAGKNNKKQWAAILFGVFLGAFGVHRFYLGYTWQGIVQAFAYPLLYTGILLAAFPPAGIVATSAIALTVFCLAAATAIWIWRWVDIFRIASGTLTPANGSEYTD